MDISYPHHHKGLRDFFFVELQMAIAQFGVLKMQGAVEKSCKMCESLVEADKIEAIRGDSLRKARNGEIERSWELAK